MQSWQNQGHGDNSWPQGFFPEQNGQFDQSQGWSQSSQQDTYPSQMNVDPATFLDNSHSMLPGYHDDHSNFNLNNQYAGQGVIDPSLAHAGAVPPDLYLANENKLGMRGGNLSQIGHAQGHNQSHTQTRMPSPPHQDYNAFAARSDQTFPAHSSAVQYSQPQLSSQPTRSQSHTPSQQFNTIHPSLTHPQGTLCQTQPSPVHQQQHLFHQSGSFMPAQVNGQTQPYPSIQPAHPSYQQPLPSLFGQAALPPFTPLPHQQPPQPVQGQNYQRPPQSQHHQQESKPLQTRINPPLHANASQQITEPQSTVASPTQAEGPSKKKQRLTKAAVESLLAEPISPRADSPLDSSVKKVDDVDDLPAPEPTPEEAQKIIQFSKRTKTAQQKFPLIKGLPHLVYESTIKLPGMSKRPELIMINLLIHIPAPKSYDKLTPLIALPPRSKKPMVPELGYSLPCEIQGNFTMQYRPLPDNFGLDERRMEGKELLDTFERSMRSLGKKRPKYTEYPHSFKEQLKADEASKNKAEKKARMQQEVERNKPTHSLTRPDDLAEAAAWDVVGIVHIEPTVSKTSSLVATRVQQAGDLFIKLRSDMTKAKQDYDKAVEDKKSTAEIEHLERQVEKTRDAFHRAIDATIENADDAVMDNLGGHQKLVLILVNILISSIKANDFNGRLPKVIFELFTHFPMTKKIAETKNFDTVRKKFADKGDKDIKEMVAEISTKLKKFETATGYAGTSAASRAKTAAAAATNPSAPKLSIGSTVGKRPRDDDAATADKWPAKKVATEVGGSSLGKKLGQPKFQLQSASKATPGKTRIVAKAVPKSEASGDSPTSSDDKAKADSKKVVKPDASKAAVKADVKTPVSKAPSGSTSSSLGISSLLDSIASAKQDTLASKKTSTPETEETEEERAKRLRKETKRKLRVSWKPESELVQIQVFEREEDSDSPWFYNMIRDAAHDHGAHDHAEGMMLKRRVDVEEEEDDDDVPYQPWSAPAPVDFAMIPEETKNKSYVTRGGNVTFTTDEQAAIAKREQIELMAVYPSADAIPPTPKSPVEAQEPNIAPAFVDLPVNQARFDEVHLRWKEEKQVGIDNAFLAAMQRLDQKYGSARKLDSILGQPKDAPTIMGPIASNQFAAEKPYAMVDTNIPLLKGAAVAEQVLVLLRSDEARSWRDPSPIHTDSFSRAWAHNDPIVHMAGMGVEAVAKLLASKPYPATSPPDYLKGDEERVREWWLGHNKETTAKLKREQEERARIQATQQVIPQTYGPSQDQTQDWGQYYAQQQQQQQYASYHAILQQMSDSQQQQQAPQQQPAASLTPDIQAVLAAMGQSSAHAPLPPSIPAPGANYLNPNDPSYSQLSLLMQMAASNQNPGQTSTPYNDREQERDWDRGNDYRDRHGEREKDRGAFKKKKGPGPTTAHKPIHAALIGTKPCTFWQQGKCARGDKCTFKHG